MKHVAISFALASLVFAAVGCADDANTQAMTEADIPASVLAELDSDLDLIIIDTQAQEWSVAEGRAPSRRATADAPFNKNYLDRFGASNSGVDQDRLTHGDPVVAAETGAVREKSNLPTDVAFDPSAPVVIAPVVLTPTSETGMQAKTNLPSDVALDPSARVVIAPSVVTPTSTSASESGIRSGMSKKSNLPTTNYSDEYKASENGLDASAVCECVGNDCVGKWVNNNVGCDVCVVFSCDNGSFPSACVTCN